MLGFTPLGGAAIADGKLPTTSGPAPSLWTVPFTWTDETDVPGVGSADFNVEIRDHLNVLKTPLDASGKIRGLSSTYFRNVDASEITGIAHGINVPNSYTGTNRFDSGSGRVVVPELSSAPSGAGQVFLKITSASPLTSRLAWCDESGVARSLNAGALIDGGPFYPGRVGSLWVEGDGLYFVAHFNNDPWKVLAISREMVQSGSPGVKGSVWIESEFLHYVDANGDEWLITWL